MPFVGRLSVNTEELHLPMRYCYFPLDSKPVFPCHGDINTETFSALPGIITTQMDDMTNNRMDISKWMTTRTAILRKCSE